MKDWAVYAPGVFVVVPADTSDEARAKVLELTGFASKPYLARDWNIHEASTEEAERYTAMALNRGRSRPTAAIVKNPPRGWKAPGKTGNKRKRV